MLGKCCGQCQERDASGEIKLKIRLPGVTKALESPNLSHLPPTQEISRGLVKLYTRRVSKPKPSSLSYEETPIVVALAKDPSKREGLKEALGVSDWQLHSEEEWDQEIREAKEKGRREATPG